MPEDTELGFEARELAARNATRRAAPRFDPYRKSEGEMAGRLPEPDP